jgi:hypothetical protein
MSDYQSCLKTAMKKDGRENEKRRTSAELTHEILQSEDSSEIKVMRLHTECGFGMMRAEELVYGAARPKRPYQNREVDKDIRRFYKHDS